jgi:hypothetical protein
LANASLALFRCSNYPADISPQEWHERGHALTVAFQGLKRARKEFQIYVAPIIGTKITEERFMMNEPSGVRNDQTETSADGALVPSPSTAPVARARPCGSRTDRECNTSQQLTAETADPPVTIHCNS